MRLATLDDGGLRVGIVEGDRIIPLDRAQSMPAIVAGEAPRRDAAARSLPLSEASLGPAVPWPGAIYTVGLNYRSAGGPNGEALGDRESPAGSPAGRPARPLIYGKAASSVAAPNATLAWDRSVTDNVDAECELGVVIGRAARNVTVAEAPEHVFGYTIVNDVSSRDEWLDGDQWLLGKSLPGFCPVGPWIVTRDELDPSDLALGCRINGQPIQDGRTSAMRFTIPEIVAFLSQHLELRPGDLIATGTPARLSSPPGPDRRLRAGDTVTAWIEGIGELVTHVA